MVQDPMTDPFGEGGGGKIVEGIHIEAPRDSVTDFADGPTTSVVVVEDHDPATGKPLPGVKFVPPGRGRKMGRYVFPDDIYSSEFIRTSVLGAVLKTMRLFSDQDVLGRPVTWAFDKPQLRVLPRAGEGANACYDRDTGCLKFFYFKNPNNPEQTVYTSLSRDIVAHETGHAIIDGIAPALYDALTPQSIAVHEAFADLTALFTAFQSNTLRLRVLEKTRGSIRSPTAFTSLAPEFARALDREGRASALRSLWNDRTLDPADRSRDKLGRPNLVSADDPHALSEVLSGALYRVMVKLHEQMWGDYGKDFSRSGRALADAVARFQRLVFRAIDLLPPGEVSFADYARALSAKDKDSFDAWGDASHWLADELKRRHCITDEEEVQRDEPDGLMSRQMDPDTLVKNDTEAYRFVSRNRKLFNIPPRVALKLYPRFRTSQGPGWGKEWETERSDGILLKASWEQIEEDHFDAKFPRARSITCGTTVELNYQGAAWHVVSANVEAQRPERDRMVRSLLEAGLLRHPTDDQDDAGPSTTPVRTFVRKGVMKVTGAGRLLHFHRKTG
jgi:hypothetical protein